MSGLIFAIHIWNPVGTEPDSIGKVIAREKDLCYASRAKTHIDKQKQLHKLRHIITEMTKAIPQAARHARDARDDRLWLRDADARCAPARPAARGEDYSKNIDFIPAGIMTRWRSGYHDAVRMLAQKPWTHDFDPMENVILHELAAGEMVAER